MRYIIKILTALLCLVALFSPVAAIITDVSSTSTLVSNSFLHDGHYMPYQFVYALIFIGLVCLAISRIFEQTEDIFSIGAVIPLGMSAWFANVMTIESTAIVYSTVTSVVNTQIITPNPYLSITMVIFFLMSILNVIWVFFLKQADAKTGDA